MPRRPCKWPTAVVASRVHIWAFVVRQMVCLAPQAALGAGVSLDTRHRFASVSLRHALSVHRSVSSCWGAG
eukprot:12345900-Alexandrium_andersonii.AAC.1